MKIEHLAIMVADPVGFAQWYSTNLEMIIIRESKQSPFPHFLADSTKDLMLEIFRLEDSPLPDYDSVDPQIFHLAFSCLDVSETANKLVSAGAKLIDNPKVLPSGDQVAMLRDPWGVPIQLVKRIKSLI